jgi:hypothetical protein
MLATLVNLALAITLAETAWLMLWHRHPLPRGPLLANLMAGLGLLVALRLAIADASPPWVALALAAGGVAHLLDLRARWQATLKTQPMGNMPPAAIVPQTKPRVPVPASQANEGN